MGDNSAGTDTSLTNLTTHVRVCTSLKTQSAINPLKTKRICLIYKDPVPTAQ
jgi:hypothetical protein